MQHLYHFAKSSFGIACLVLLIGTGEAFAQTTTFTYQGRLTDDNFVPDGNYEMQFKLFDAAAEGNQIVKTLSFDGSGSNPPVKVIDGVYTVQLDFGAEAFPGADRFLEVAIRYPGDIRFTPLSPRQQLTSRPYAIRSLSAAAADFATNAQQLDGVEASSYVQTADPRLSDSRPPTPDSSNYIQNKTSPQSLSNFNISGNGTAGGTLSGNTVNAATHYNIGSIRVLGAERHNLFAGIGAGQSNSMGNFNAFVGANAGINNTSGANNTFVGANAGATNTSNGHNSFVGANAGAANTQGNANAFVGSSAGRDNTIGSANSFFGAFAGQSNTWGANNSFFGTAAGFHNTSGSYNSFFGLWAGLENTTGNFNSFFGTFAGYKNTTGANNSFFGNSAGTSNTQGTSNSFFGHFAGLYNTTGAGNSFFGTQAGIGNNTGFSNSFFGTLAGGGNTTGADNSFFGTGAGTSNTTGSYITLIGSNANVGSDGLYHATAVGAGSVVSSSNTVVLGRSADTVEVPGILKVTTLGAAGSNHLCLNDLNQIAHCSSSLRYKTNITPFSFGLDLVSRLHPISFDWKTDGQRDVGFGAEGVAALNPLFVIYNSKGQVEGVKYDRLSVAFVNAFKEQQAQIELQRAQLGQHRDQIRKQENQLDVLRKLVCLAHPNADVCK